MCAICWKGRTEERVGSVVVNADRADLPRNVLVVILGSKAVILIEVVRSISRQQSSCGLYSNYCSCPKAASIVCLWSSRPNGVFNPWRFLMVNCWSLYLYATMDVITIGAPSVHIRAVKKIKLWGFQIIFASIISCNRSISGGLICQCCISNLEMFFALQILRLSACKYLSESALDALHGGKVLSELEELDISYGSLGRAAIEGVLAHCPHLTHVSLNGCAHVTDHLWSHLACPPTLGLGRSEDVGMEDAFIDQQSPMDVVSPSSLLSSEMIREIMCDEDLGTGELKEGVWCLPSTDDCFTPESKSSFVNLPVNSSEKTMPGLHPVCSAGEPQLSTENDGNQNQTLLPMPELEMTESLRALQILSCVGCPNIWTVKIPRDAACLSLSSLNLSLSINIREVRLGCINLTYLNLRWVFCHLHRGNCSRVISNFIVWNPILWDDAVVW